MGHNNKSTFAPILHPLYLACGIIRMPQRFAVQGCFCYFDKSKAFLQMSMSGWLFRGLLPQGEFKISHNWVKIPYTVFLFVREFNLFYLFTKNVKIFTSQLGFPEHFLVSHMHLKKKKLSKVQESVMPVF